MSVCPHRMRKELTLKSPISRLVEGLFSESTDSTPSPFARFPVELVCDILELAARECRDSALTFALISRTVHYWITPILYRTVLLPNRMAADRFHRGLGEAIGFDWGLDPDFAGPGNVRNVFLSPENKADSVDLTILTLCPHVERLVLDVHASLCAWKEVDSTLPWPAPWEVAVTAYDSGDWLGHPVLHNLTHLYLQMPVLCSGKDILPEVLSLHQLTHLSLGSYWAGDELVALTERLLSASTSLEMVLLHSLPNLGCVGEIWVELAKIPDERLLVRPGLSLHDFGELLTSEGTIWDDARVKFEDWREGASDK